MKQESQIHPYAQCQLTLISALKEAFQMNWAEVPDTSLIAFQSRIMNSWYNNRSSECFQSWSDRLTNDAENKREKKRA